MYLFFDTETTGLPRNYKASVFDLTNWPRLVQIAWILQDENGNTLSSRSHIIKPKGFSIPVESSDIHKITTERAHQEGTDLRMVLTDFAIGISKCQYMVAHNVSFDEKIVGAEFLRNSMSNTITTKKLLCTMENSKNHCAINGQYGYKWPKLNELHYKLFNCNFDGAHDATADINATKKCFWEMRRLGLI